MGATQTTPTPREEESEEKDKTILEEMVKQTQGNERDTLEGTGDWRMQQTNVTNEQQGEEGEEEEEEKVKVGEQWIPLSEVTSDDERAMSKQEYEVSSEISPVLMDDF